MEPRKRWIAVVVSFVAAVCFGLSLQLAWWTVGEVAIGPYGTRACFGGECRPAGLSWIIGAEDLWMRSAIAARAAGYIALIALLALAGALAAKRIPHLVSRASLVSLLTAAACGGYFAFAYPGMAQDSIAPGSILYFAGIALGFVGPILVMRSAR